MTCDISVLNSLLESQDFPEAKRKTITLAEYYSLSGMIDTCPVEFQRPYDPDREYGIRGLAQYILDLMFNRHIKPNLLPALVIRQLTEYQIKCRIKNGRKKTHSLEIVDGQHRTVVMFKLLSGEITIPDNFTANVNGKDVSLGGMTIPQMIQLGGSFKKLVETRVNTLEICLDYYHNITDQRAAEIFAERNSGASQSRQGIRNCQTHKTSVLIRGLSRDVPEYNSSCHPLMSCDTQSDGSLFGKYFLTKMNSSLNFDEDVARTLATIIGYDCLKKNESFSLDQNSLDSMYQEYGDVLSDRYIKLLSDVLDFEYKLLSKITVENRKDRMKSDKGFWNALRYISVMLVCKANQSGKTLSFNFDRNPEWIFWREFNKLITSLCKVPKKDEEDIKQTLFDRSLSKMNWFSESTGTGLKVVFDQLEKWLKNKNMSDIGLVMKDRRETFSAKTRSILYVEQDGRDAITGEYIDYCDAVTDHKKSRATGGETKEENAQVVSSYTNSMKGAH
jgi:hypothetical protein